MSTLLMNPVIGAQAIAFKPVINLGEEPFVPDGYVVQEHIVSGIGWDPAKVRLYWPVKSYGLTIMRYNELCKQLEGKYPYNVNLLRSYIANGSLIPEEVKRRDLYVFLLGTIYRSISTGGFYVYFFTFGGKPEGKEMYGYDLCPLTHEFRSCDVVAVPWSMSPTSIFCSNANNG